MKSLPVVVLVTIMAATLAGCGGAEERKNAHLEKGRALLAENNYDKARVEFSNVLQIDQKDKEARLLLAQTYEKLQDWRNAAAHYLRLIEDDPEHIEARIKMGQIYALGHAFDKAMEQVDEVLKRQADNVDALALRGGIRQQQGDSAAAILDAQAALNKDPAHLNAMVLLASLHLQNKEPDKAMVVLRDAQARHPENSNLRTLLAKIYVDAGKNDDALTILRESVSRDPKVLMYRLQLTALQIKLNDLDGAEQTLHDAIRDLPEENTAKLALAEFLATRRDRGKAESELANWIKEQPDVYEFRFAHAALLEATDQPDKARQAYDEILAKDEKGPHGLKAKVRLAGLAARQKDLKRADELLAEILKDNPRDKDALTLRAQIAMTRQDYATAIADFRSVLKDDPLSARHKRLLARAHFLNHENDLARSTLQDAVAASPEDMQLRGDYLQLLAEANDMKGVVAQLEDILRISPGNLGALETLFKAHSINRDWAAARQTADRLREKYPDKPHAYYFGGLVNQAEGKVEESLGDFEEALKRAPDAIEPLTQLIKSHLALKQKDKAVERIDQAIAVQPTHFVAHNLKGEILLVDRKFDEATAAFAKARELNPKWPVPYNNVAVALEVQKDPDGAIKVLKDGIAATENSPVLITSLAALYERTGAYDDAIALYEDIIQESPDAILAANNLAMLLAEYKADAGGLERAKKLVELIKDSKNPAFLDTVGWVRLKLGETDTAVPALEEAIKGAPDSPTIHYHLGIAYQRKGNPSGARDHLTKAMEAKVPFPGMEAAKAALAELNGG